MCSGHTRRSWFRPVPTRRPAVFSDQGARASDDVRERYRQRLRDLRRSRANGTPLAGQSSTALLDPAPVVGV
eukprot:11209491-Lingulodinium_polyedra.AAC.1